MYKKQTNPVALRSQQYIGESLYQLMDQKPYSEITVTELCQNAGVGRKTFYRNFETIEDVLSFNLDSFFRSFIKNCPKNPTYYEYSYYFFLFCKTYRHTLTRLYKSNLFFYIVQRFMLVADEIIVVWKHKKSIETNAFVVGGFVSLVYQWASHDFQTSIDELALSASEMLEKIYNN